MKPDRGGAARHRALVRQPAEDGPPHARRVGVLIALIVTGTLVLALGDYLREAQAERLRDEALAARTAEVFEDVVHGTLIASGTAGALVDEDGSVDAARFEVFARSMIRQPGVLAVAWQRHVPGDELADFEADTGTDVWERSEDGVAVVVNRRDGHLPVIDAWPEQYQTLVGFDMLSEPVRAEAAEEARDSGEPVVSAPVALLPENRPGVIVFVPLYRPGMPTATPSERREAFTGTATVGHFADAFLRHVTQQAGTHVRVTDGGRLLAQTDPPPTEGAQASAAIAGKEWTVTVRHPVRASLVNVMWILAAGSALALAVGWSFRQTARHAENLREAHDQLAALVAAVQQGALRPPPQLPESLEVAVRYLPAAEHARLGGDWYDLFRTPDGRLFMTVGDVSGHGIDAITHMQQVRQVIAAFAYEGHPPAALLRLTDELLATEPSADGHFATVWLGYLDPCTGHLAYASAGHPSALVAVPGSEPTALETASALPLNLRLEGPGWLDQELELPPGGALLLYTDGVVESSTAGLDAGVPTAAALLADDEQPLEALADRLMAARPDPGRDDAALVLVRRRPADA